MSHLCEFLVADALDAQAGGLRGRRFDTILDSACLQCFDPALQIKYLENMEALMAGGGGFVLLVVCNQSQLRSWCRSVHALRAPRGASACGGLTCGPLPARRGVRWMQEHLRKLFTRERGWTIASMDQSTFLENIPMVRITRGVRTFEPVTPSPCIVMCATRPRKLPVPVLCAGGLAAAVAGICFLLLLSKRRG